MEEFEKGTKKDKPGFYCVKNSTGEALAPTTDVSNVHVLAHPACLCIEPHHVVKEVRSNMYRTVRYDTCESTRISVTIEILW